MSPENQKLLSELFQRYGHPAPDAQFSIHGYFRKAENIMKGKDIQQADETARRLIREFQFRIEQLNAYRISLAEQYNFLETAPSVPVVRLSRRRDYYTGKVFYDLCISRRYVETAVEVEESRCTYPGSERRQAIREYQSYLKSHPGIIAKMDIAKKHWEK